MLGTLDEPKYYGGGGFQDISTATRNWAIVDIQVNLAKFSNC